MYVCNSVYFDAFLTLRYRWNIFIAYKRHYATECLIILFLIYSSFPFPLIFPLETPRYNFDRNCSHLLVRLGLFVSKKRFTFETFIDGLQSITIPNISLTSVSFSLSLFYGYSFILPPFQFSSSSNANFSFLFGWVT